MSKVEDRVCETIQARAAVRLFKHGVGLDRDDLSFLDWLIHLQHELMDSINYIERLIMIEEEKIRGNPAND
jgi:hypothetical protein